MKLARQKNRQPSHEQCRNPDIKPKHRTLLHRLTLPARRPVKASTNAALAQEAVVMTLIIVGVILDTMRQVETHLIQRHYDGFLRKGRIRGRFDRTTGGQGEAVQEGAMLWLYVGIAALLVAGLAVFLAGKFH